MAKSTQQQKQTDETRKRFDEVKPVVFDIIKIVGNKVSKLDRIDVNLAQMSVKDREVMTDIAENIMARVLEEKDFKQNHVSFTFQIISLIFSNIATIVDKTVDGHYANATAKLWGVEDLDNLTVQAIHERLIEMYENNQTENNTVENKKIDDKK